MDKLFGMPVYTSPLLARSVAPTWVDKVLAWNPCNDWRTPQQIADQVLMVNMDALRVGFDLGSRDGTVAFIMSHDTFEVIERKQMMRMGP